MCDGVVSTTLPAALIFSLLVALDGDTFADDVEEGDDSVVDELATALEH